MMHPNSFLAFLLYLILAASAPGSDFQDWYQLNDFRTISSTSSLSGGPIRRLNVTVASDGAVVGLEPGWMIKHNDPPFPPTGPHGHNEWAWFRESPLDMAFGLRRTFDDGFIAAGSASGTPHLSMWRTNSLGLTEWQKTFPRPQLTQGGALLEAADGGFLVAGSERTVVNRNGSDSGLTVFLFKTDARGDLLWERRYPSVSFAERAQDLVETQDGGYLISGRQGVGIGYGGAYYGFLLKTDALGNPVWRKVYSAPSSMEKQTVLRTASGNFLMCRSSVFDWDDSRGETLLHLVDPSGNTLWVRKVPGKSAACLETPEKGFLIATSYLFDGEGKLALGLTDSSGNILRGTVYPLTKIISAVTLLSGRPDKSYSLFTNFAYSTGTPDFSPIVGSYIQNIIPRFGFKDSHRTVVPGESASVSWSFLPKTSAPEKFEFASQVLFTDSVLPRPDSALIYRTSMSPQTVVSPFRFHDSLSHSIPAGWIAGTVFRYQGYFKPYYGENAFPDAIEVKVHYVEIDLKPLKTLCTGPDTVKVDVIVRNASLIQSLGNIRLDVDILREDSTVTPDPESGSG